MHDIVPKSAAQLRDLGFHLREEVFSQISAALAQRYREDHSGHCITTADLWSRCQNIIAGSEPRQSLDAITHVLTINGEIRVAYAMLDANYYRTKLAEHRKAARRAEVPDVQKLRSIRLALDKLDELKLITKPKASETVEPTMRYDEAFELDLGDYYQFIHTIPYSGSPRGELLTGTQQFKIDEFRVNHLDEFKEKQVDVALAVAAMEKILDQSKKWTIGILTSDADYVPVFQRAVSNGTEAFLVLFESTKLPYAYRQIGLADNVIRIGDKFGDYVKNFEYSRIARLYRFMGLAVNVLKLRERSDLLDAIRVEMGREKFDAFVAGSNSIDDMTDELLKTHLKNCRQLYGYDV